MKNYLFFLFMIISVALSAQRYLLISIDSAEVITSIKDTSKFQLKLYGYDDEGNFLDGFILTQQRNGDNTRE